MIRTYRLLACLALTLPAAAEVVSGPVLVAASRDELTVWLQMDGTGDVSIIHDIDSALAYPRTTRTVAAKASDGYCATVTMENLQPDTRYFYRVLVNGSASTALAALPIFEARTIPESPGTTRVGVARLRAWRNAPNAAVWPKLSTLGLNVMFWVEDGGDGASVEALAASYREHHGGEGLRATLSRVPHVGVWNGQPDVERHALFRRYWPDTSEGVPGPAAERPGAALVVFETGDAGSAPVAYDVNGNQLSSAGKRKE